MVADVSIGQNWSFLHIKFSCLVPFVCLLKSRNQLHFSISKLIVQIKVSMHLRSFPNSMSAYKSSTSSSPPCATRKYLLSSQLKEQGHEPCTHPFSCPCIGSAQLLWNQSLQHLASSNQLSCHKGFKSSTSSQHVLHNGQTYSSLLI